MNSEIKEKIEKNFLLNRKSIKSQNMFLQEYLLEKIIKSIEIFKEAKKVNSALSISGGVDSIVLNDLNCRFNIGIDSLFFNKAVENYYNIEMINKVKKHYKNIYDAKSKKSYKGIVWEYGFPIANKNFSSMCYRIRKVDRNNFIDVYKVITGISPKNVGNDKKVSQLYSLDLKFWHFATTYPIQEQCCRILKKDPSKKLNMPMIVGIMKDDSPARRKAINTNYDSEDKEKFYPLGDWNKQDVRDYIDIFNVEISKAYLDRELKDGTIIVGATNTGCTGCHYGNTQNHFYIDKFGIKHKTTKFENLKRESPRIHRNIMKMKHKSGVTFKEVLEEHQKSKDGLYLKESIVARNNYIKRVISYLENDDENWDSAIRYIKKFLKSPTIFANDPQIDEDFSCNECGTIF